MLKKILIILAVVLLALGSLGWWQRERIISLVFSPRQSDVPVGNVDTAGILEVANSLDTPWEIVPLPTGELLVTQRGGELIRVGTDDKRYSIEGVLETSEGGLMGLALHPEFSSNRYIYLAVTTTNDSGPINQIRRYTLEDDQVSNRQIIVDNIPAAQVHDGGRIAFGPDGKLYITTGDANKEELAQDTSSLAGKILRVNDDGSVPADNPFGNEVWSYGHRNPQGIAWDAQGRLWSTEHGPSGPNTGNDELNLIEKGSNYGWPVIVGDEQQPDMVGPKITSGDDDTWAPASLVFVDDNLYFAGLRAQTLYRVSIDEKGNTGELKAYLTSDYGRLRAVASRDDSLYIGTSNRDGRGQPSQTDDTIYRILLRDLR